MTIRSTLIRAAAVAGALLALAACTHTDKAPALDLRAINHGAAETLAAGIDRPTLSPVLVTSLADVNALDASSTFGRVSAEQLGTRLSQLGFTVVEARLGHALTMQPNGEFMLSREVRDLAERRKAAAVLVGTYGKGGASAFVTVRLVRVADGVVVASHDYEVPLDYAWAPMLRSDAAGRGVRLAP